MAVWDCVFFGLIFWCWSLSLLLGLFKEFDQFGDCPQAPLQGYQRPLIPGFRAGVGVVQTDALRLMTFFTTYFTVEAEASNDFFGKRNASLQTIVSSFQDVQVCISTDWSVSISIMFSNPTGSQQNNSFGRKNWTPGSSLFQLHHLCRGWFTATRWCAGARQSDDLPVVDESLQVFPVSEDHGKISANATIYRDFNLQQHLVVKWKGQGAFFKEVNSTCGSQVNRKSWAHPGTAKVDVFYGISGVWERCATKFNTQSTGNRVVPTVIGIICQRRQWSRADGAEPRRMALRQVTTTLCSAPVVITAQGGGRSFKNRKSIGEVGCCESRMAERIHWWNERWLRSPLFLSLSLSFSLFLSLSLFFCLSVYLSIYLSVCLSIYLSTSLSLSISLPVCLSIYQSVCLSIYLTIYLSIYLSIYPSIYLSFYLSICLSIYLSSWLSIYLSIYLSTYLSMYLSIDLSLYLFIYLSVCLSICLSIYLSSYLSTYLSIYVSMYLSIYRSIYLSIYLSICLSICLSVCLSVCLSASLKTKLFCETSSFSEVDNIKNEAILGDFIFWTGQHPKRSKSVRLLQFLNVATSKTKQFCEISFKNGKLSAELTASYQCVLQFFQSTCRKYCACHKKVMPGHTKCCTCHAKSSQQTWRSDVQNATPLRKSAPSPPNSSDEDVSCIAPAKENPSLQILFKCPTHLPSFLDMPQNPHVLLTFDKVHNPLRLPCETRSEPPKVVRTCCALYFLTSKCVSRLNGVHFFDISISKSGLRMVCFVHVDFEMCFAPQRRAIFHLSSGQMAPHLPL